MHCRKYERQIRAEVEVEMKEAKMMSKTGDAFRMLAGFIFGKNTKGGKSEPVAMTAPVLMSANTAKKESEAVAMTAPVLMSSSPNTMKMSFVMPSQYKSISDLPTPKDSRVVLREVPEETYAVIRFKQFAEETFKSEEKKLRALAEKEGVALNQDASKVKMAGYNPPWCLPWFRTTEVMIPVISEEAKVEKVLDAVSVDEEDKMIQKGLQ
jgi:hypothetical protein